MTPTLDLLFLTFNCAKNLINASVFASHLQTALTQNATDLPDLVVFSLQEIAPLSYAFIGGYFLSSYYARYDEALNLAAVRVLTAETTSNGQNEGDDAQPVVVQPRDTVSARPYTLVRAKNVGMTAIVLFAKNPSAIKHIEEAECGFGAADMGNKGAVGLRITYSPGDAAEDGEAPSTELTLVATHLAAMEWNLKRRNANWRTIVSGLTFANPRSVLPGVFPPDDSAPKPDRTGSQYKTQPETETDSADISEAEEEAEEDQALLSGDGDAPEPEQLPLHPDHPHITREHHTTLHDISIFKPTSHLFIGGDLNYRISTTTPPPMSNFPSFDPASEHYYPAFLNRDQLSQERLARRTFHGMTEAPVTFGPSYKYNVLPDATGAVNERAVRAGAIVNGVPEVPWKFAPHRWPGWCDRVLYLDLPSWVKSKSGSEIQPIAYDLLPVMRTSDHRPVFLRARVPIVDADTMRSPPEDHGGQVDVEGEADPRAVLPVPINVHAWERRAAARRKELAVGLSAILWSTREGAMVLATVLLVGVGGWWLMHVW